MSRFVVRVQWSKTAKAWKILVAGQFFNARWYKDEAVRDARRIARNKWQDADTLSQLVVHNKNGRIQFENTYGRDPKRFKG